MRAWERIQLAGTCGECGRLLEDNEPAQFITLNGVKRKLIRCQACAGPAPPDLPLNVIVSPTTRRMKPLKSAAKEWMPFRETD